MEKLSMYVYIHVYTIYMYIRTYMYILSQDENYPEEKCLLIKLKKVIGVILECSSAEFGCGGSHCAD